ncbi:MAG TPA: stage II sporulation protein M [Acidobacteriota bacterium]|nr:stage II sporulation protein M [Acidobacteriota bacterium]
MHSSYTIRTPDHVEIEFEVAGPLGRFAALLLDTLIIIGSMLVLVLLASFFGLLSLVTDAGSLRATSSVAMALLGLIFFILNWGYFVLLEHFMRGRTPGKAAAGLRVMRDDGFPVSLRESAIRNLVRAADMLPIPTYMLGGIVALYHPHGKRLGDMAAGTLVVREGFATDPLRASALRSSSGWLARVEAGQSRQAVTLPRGKIDSQRLALIRKYMDRRLQMNPDKRAELAWRITHPFLEMMGEDPQRVAAREDRSEYCEGILRAILDRASQQAEAARRKSRPVKRRQAEAGPGPPVPESDEMDAAARKRMQWLRFSRQAKALLKSGKPALRRLPPEQIEQLSRDYRRINADLARARSMGGDSEAVLELNRIAMAGHLLFYGYARPGEKTRPSASWLTAFPKAFRRSLGPVGLSAFFLFVPALITAFAVMWNPSLGYDLVPVGFLDFEPARQDTMHEFPQLMRPLAASSIMTNNLQVSLMAFGLGLTAGIGSALLLIYNGIHLGAVAGWMTLNGNGRALWGWIMPHGGTELLAIVLAGAAGFLLARAIAAPGVQTRSEALKRIAPQALTLELGVMVMLVFAGLVEGFISPSTLGFGGRILFLGASLLMWFLYLSTVGLARDRREEKKASPDEDS